MEKFMGNSILPLMMILKHFMDSHRLKCILQQIRGLIYPLEVVIENPTNLYSETVTTEADPHYVQNTIRVQQGS